MRLVAILITLLCAAPAVAQELDVEGVVQGAAAERKRARCMLRAARRVERLAARYAATQDAAARARLAERISAVGTEKQACLNAVDAEYSAGVGTIGRRPQQQPTPRTIRLVSRVVTTPGDSPVPRRGWARSRARIRYCIRQTYNTNPSEIRPFALNYVVDASGAVGPITGAPPRIAHCFEALRRLQHPAMSADVHVRVMVRIDVARAATWRGGRVGSVTPGTS